MTHRLGAWFVAVLLAALAVPPVAAHAERVVTDDPSGDARAWTYFQEFQFVPAPQEASADITRTAAAFGQRRLSVAVHLRDLEVRPRHETLLRIWTHGDTFDVSAERLSARRATVSVARQRGEAFGCRGLRVTYDGAADIVALFVPARCIGAPRWVRLGVKVTASPEADPEAQTMTIYFADDGHRDTHREDSLGKGPRIRRG